MDLNALNMDDSSENQNSNAGFNFFGTLLEGNHNNDNIFHDNNDEDEINILTELSSKLDSFKFANSRKESSFVRKDDSGYEADIVNKIFFNKAENTLNEYTLLSEIGSGSFGKVIQVLRNYLDEDEKTILQSKYALKILKKSKKVKNVVDERGMLQIKTELELLYQELEIYKRLAHQNICKLYQIIDCPYEEDVYLVMQYCEIGQLLLLDEATQVYSKNTELDNFIMEAYSLKQGSREDIARVIFRQVGQGLQYLHDRKIANRDIKIDNILVKKEDCQNGEHVKLIDFSTAQKLMHGRVFGQVGTPAYQSPENCMPPSDGFDGRLADVWSLGVTIFTYLEVALPFNLKAKTADEPAQQALMKSIMFDPLPEMKSNPSQELKQLLDAMTAKNPSNRITTQEFLSHQWFQMSE